MHIISGKENAEQVKNKHVVLEVDTIRVASGELELFAVIEDVPFKEIEFKDENITRHESLIEDYRNRRWSDCLTKIKLLKGLWNEEMDPFYDEIIQRAELFQEAEPPASWTYVIER